MAQKVFIGSTPEVKIGLETTNSAFHLADSTTDFTAEFYVKGLEAKKKVTLTKSDVFIDSEEPDYFVAHVPTEGMSQGTLCCTVTGTYADKEHSTEEKQYVLPFVYSIQTPANLVNKYL